MAEFTRSSAARGALAAGVVLLSAPHAWALGTPAGTDITNQATATYQFGNQTVTQTSNVTTTRVAELLNVSVVWQDASNIQVAAGDTSRVTTFRVTNTGNGSDAYDLAALSVLPGDDFDPIFQTLYLDANANGTFDPGFETVYSPGVNDPALAPDEFLTVFCSNDIPAGPTDGDLGDTQVTATSKTGSGVTGTVFPGAGELGTDAIVGTTGASSAATGTYIVSSISVQIVKSVVVTDPFGSSDPIPGANLRYTVTVDVTGTGIAQGIVVTDAIPTNTTYVTGTLNLNFSSLTDAADADAGDVGGTTPGTVTVTLGDMVDTSPIQTVTFDVTID